MEPLLKVEHLRVSYGPITAVKDVSIEVHPHEIVAVLGANGAGKTTLLRAISGLVRPSNGTISLGDVTITGWPPHTIARRGVAHVPEGRGTLGRMTVLENLRLGAFNRRDDEIQSDVRELYERFPILAERRHVPASLLSGGQQQMLAIARAWMARPRVILLDEPSLGLAPLITREVFQMIEAARARAAVLLVEQNTRVALRAADRGYVMELGRVALEGPSDDLLRDEKLLNAYLGQRAIQANEASAGSVA